MGQKKKGKNMNQAFYRYCKQCGQELKSKCAFEDIVTAMYCKNAECHLYGIHQEGVSNPMDIIQNPDVPQI